MLTALAFAHFSSELLLKEQMIIPVKKTLNNAGHIDAKLIVFSEICSPKTAKLAVFYWLFLDEISREIGQIFYEFAPEYPSKFDFFLLKYREIGWFFREFWLFPWKSLKIGRFFRKFWLFSPRNRPIFPRIYPWKSRKILLFFPRNIRSPEETHLPKWFKFPLLSVNLITL